MSEIREKGTKLSYLFRELGQKYDEHAKLHSHFFAKRDLLNREIELLESKIEELKE